MIYIVEDDVSILGLEEYALQNSGFETRGFSDGESFLKACDQQIPQMAVLDVMLPGDDGIAILGKIRSDVRLRQAVSLAIDRQLIVDQLWGGYAKPTQNLLNRMCPDWVELPVEYDMDRAKELAREVLGEERITLDMYTRSLYLDRGPYKEMMEYIQSQLAQIGIDATVNIIDSSTYSEMSKAGELGANFMTHGMSNLNAYHFLNLYMSSDGSYNQSQHLAYHNSKADELLAEMSTTLDDERFHELAVELQEIANTELPVIPLFYDTSNLIYNQQQITGYEDFSDHLDLSHLAWVNVE